MLNKRHIFLIITVFFISTGLIFYFSISHMNSLRELKELANEEPKFKPTTFLDLNDKKIMEDILRKIRNFESLESNQIRHLSLSEIEEEKKNSEKMRNLAEGNIFEDPTLVDPLRDSYYSITRWITATMKQFSSNIILYPYAFDYTYDVINPQNPNITKETKQFKQGAFLSLNVSEIAPYNMGTRTNGTFTTKKARAVFASDIAILNIEYLKGYYYEESFQDGIDWSTYFQNYCGRSATLLNYAEFFEAKTKDSSRTYVTRINETEIIKGNLLNGGIPRFGILIIPDYQLGTDDIIKSKLDEIGIKNIIDFYNRGGKIIVNGKSGTLLEDFNLMTKGVYDRNLLLSINNANRAVKTKGCENTFSKPYSEKDNDFEKQMICLSVTSYKEITLATSFKTVKNDNSYSRLIDLDSSNPFLVTTNINDGLTFNLTEEEKTNNPLILFKKNNRGGQIFVLNYNPVHEGGDRNILLNIIAFALSKDLFITSKVNMNINSEDNKDVPIPAGEAGFKLQISTLIHNLNDKDMKNSKLYLFLADNLGWMEFPTSICQKKQYIKSEIPANIRQKKTFENSNEYLECDLKTVTAYQRLELKVSISVLNYQATQKKYQVLIIEPIFTFIDYNNQENIFFDQIRVNCVAAPLIRAALNPDPSAMYPLPGTGFYSDNVLKIENKEESPAYDVEYYGLIPLVSPITDGFDQRKTRWSIKIWPEYYNSNKFEVPLKSLDAEDYIYSAELKGKGVIMISEWDSPVLPTKENYNRNEKGLGEGVYDLTGINNGLVTINSTTEVIKQINYRISDRFYKLASQRLMVFIDDTTPQGAKTLYNGDMDDTLMDPKYKDRAKIDFLFARNDIFFYNNKNYAQPPEISETPEKYVFSIDKYIEYANKDKDTGCAKQRGQARSIIAEKGYFTNFDSDKKSTILKPNIYTNELFDYCNLNVIDPTKENEIKNIFGNSSESFKLIHYIVPNVEKNITLPGQLYNFTQDDNYHGHHNKYPSIKFIYLHSLTYTINSKYCVYGGRIIINLKNFVLNSTEDVTISPDQIAVYKKEYNNENHNLIIYFKRGLMSNEQFGKDVVIKINIENLNSHKEETFSFTLEELKFDISSPTSDYEKYYKVPIPTKEQTFNYTSAFSLPALQIKATLNTSLNGYETLEPFNRYGVYIQELGHRTVYAYAETHLETDPGVVGGGDGFSTISNLGISSIPFVEYMSVGKGQLIPAGPYTSRVSWKDIWGRTWQQPLRALFPDIPPIPPPLKNFMMTTTYQLIKTNTNKQIYEWASDEDALIHLHIKLLNNYPKYFEITRCKENQIRFVPYSMNEFHDREYENKSRDNLTENELNGNNMFLRQGGMASYGVCFSDENAYASGSKIEGELLSQVEQAKLCADYTDAKLIKQCAEELENIKTISRSPKNWNEEKDGKWNYSPLVENYYPKGYIKLDMWQLTHIDYYDTPMDKAYKYHMDNLLPNYDAYDGRFESPDIIKPHNTIAIPLYKGLGYNMIYNKNFQITYNGKVKRGWWSDNLQNKDDTLLAGQSVSNDISVNKESQITWVDGKDLKGSNRKGSDDAAKKIIQNKQKNIYACLFNRRRPQYKPDNAKSFHPRNVVENNVIPIVIDLDRYDKRLTQYNCNVSQYTPDNIYQYDGNYLETPTSKDYLYFGANLRGGAKETINVIMKLEKFDKVKYEGNVKVNEGGRFVYWNPANGPNSFLIVDNPVSIIKAKRNDIEIINNIFPTKATTFNTILYHSYIIRDESKIEKEWPYTDFYTNSFGYGDVSITVSVGGIKKSKPVLQPGGTTYAKIIFYNNCGFDWNMKDNAMKFEYKGEEPLNGYDLLFRIVHAIKVPLEYTFLKYEVEEKYRPYITIIPSDHNINTPPEFFDFENINVATIRDGFKGEYNLKIDVKSNFPDALRGKPIEIKIIIQKQYFDRFPGYETDPIKNNVIHTYNVEVPSIYIAVPFNSGNFNGKVLYTSCQANNLNIDFNVGVDWKIDGVKYISKNLLEQITNATLEDNSLDKINSYWNKLSNEKNINFIETKLSETLKKITINGIKDEYEYFPKKQYGKPDIAEAIVIVRSSISQLSYGTLRPISGITIRYNDWINKPKYSNTLAPFVVVSGPWLALTYSRTLVEKLGEGKYVEKPDQQLYPEDSGTMKVLFKLTNTGNGHSYNTKYQIILEPNLVFDGYYTGSTSKISLDKNDNGQTVLTFDYGAPIMSKELKGGIIYLNYSKICDSYDILTEDEKNELPKELLITKESAVYMDLTNKTGENRVVERLRQPLDFAYTIKNKTEVFVDLIISGSRKNPTIKIRPKVKYYGNDTVDNIQLYIGKMDTTEYKEELRKLIEIEESLNYTTLYNKGKFIKEQKDRPNVKQPENKKHNVWYTVVIYGNGDTTTSSRTIKYEQEKIHMTTIELVLIILSIFFYAASVVLFYGAYLNYKGNKDIEGNVKNSNIDKLISEK